MAYDEDLAERIRELLATTAGVDEKRMFGGLAFLVHGHMAVCASAQGGLMVRVAAEDTANLLTRAHVEPMVMAGRDVLGWIRVSRAGLDGRRQLQPWVTRGVAYASSLPPK
ncbi:TfoX/Sxy family protein [Mycolicibacterium diernhoferi]|uniref:RNA methyltransferase n=1 Tax=Mycolicibacterium diernhoferi TaxID=1801 RepID=A0A1Q4H3Y4_9MYCO|nr:TfoX/Sxy family protein [Mycolicibacterium diernhoferi]OJZ61227.1 RNA methyltransferase [Mycolicibacterium diernhoferi]OPE54046.1 RNA methyltransferase [Mycolicibacterium diernhoferi]PEG55702.1 RNA methyltransferase [Mycolicibacterium diernhoferi]QYL20598.1 TfoX/Sxy family protein [Mycolicibacterium diernhoferi]